MTMKPMKNDPSPYFDSLPPPSNMSMTLKPIKTDLLPKAAQESIEVKFLNALEEGVVILKHDRKGR